MFLQLLRVEKYLSNHLRASQSAYAKSTLHLCGVYLYSIFQWFVLVIATITKGYFIL